MESMKTTEMMVSYPSLTVARSVAGGGEKYQVVLVQTENTDVEALKNAFLAAGQEKFGDKLPALLKKAEFKRALKKQPAPDPDDEEVPRYPVGAYFISCYSPTKPEAVDRYVDPATGKPRRLTDEEVEEKLYPGCKARAVIRFYGYDKGGNKGIACAINAIQWLGDGERLDNRVKAEDAFDGEQMDEADLPEPAEAPATPAPSRKASAAKGAKPAPTNLDDLL